MQGAHYGIALFNAERQLMWARAENNLTLEEGVHYLSHSFASLPLRPGAYQWQVSLWDGGKMLDLWDCLPEMTIATARASASYGRVERDFEFTDRIWGPE